MLNNTMKVALLAAMLLTSAFSSAELIEAKALLNYDQEVTPSNATPSDSMGMATITFDTMALTLDISVDVTGISLADITFPDGGLAFGALGPFHIHNGVAGVNAGIVVPFSLASYYTETATGIMISAMGVSFDAVRLEELMNDGLYLNLHTLDYGSGEIRGQIARVSAPAGLLLILLALPLLRLARRK